MIYIEELALLTATDGGVTYDVNSGEAIRHGYAVSERPDASAVFAAPTVAAIESRMRDYLLAHASDWAEGYVLGAWQGEGNSVYLDLVTIYADRARAEAAGRNANQIAIYDLDVDAEIPTGGTGA